MGLTTGIAWTDATWNPGVPGLMYKVATRVVPAIGQIPAALRSRARQEAR